MQDQHRACREEIEKLEIPCVSIIIKIDLLVQGA